METRIGIGGRLWANFSSVPAFAQPAVRETGIQLGGLRDERLGVIRQRAGLRLPCFCCGHEFRFLGSARLAAARFNQPDQRSICPASPLRSK